MMIFTSGTSGDPKAVEVPHAMVLFAGSALVERYGLTCEDVCYLAMPLFHSNAVYAGWSVAVGAGAAMAPATFSASGFLPDIRRYGATYMNYVGKPLAYILATPEKPDDHDNPLRIAFGNEAADRDIAAFSRRFGCTVWDGFGSTETAVIITRPDDCPPGSIGKGFPGVAIYDPQTVTECAVAEFDATGALANPDAAIGSWSTPRAAACSAATTTIRAPPTSACATACTGRATSRTATPTAGSTWPAAPPTGCASTARTSRPRPSSGSCCAWTPSTASRCTRCPTSTSATRSWPRSCCRTARRSRREFEEFLAAQRDLSPKAWPRYVWIAEDLPTTATNKILKRELVATGTDPAGRVLWHRDGTRFTDLSAASAPGAAPGISPA